MSGIATISYDVAPVQSDREPPAGSVKRTRKLARAHGAQSEKGYSSKATNRRVQRCAAPAPSRTYSSEKDRLLAKVNVQVGSSKPDQSFQAPKDSDPSRFKSTIPYMQDVEAFDRFVHSQPKLEDAPPPPDAFADSIDFEQTAQRRNLDSGPPVRAGATVAEATAAASRALSRSAGAAPRSSKTVDRLYPSAAVRESSDAITQAWLDREEMKDGGGLPRLQGGLPSNAPFESPYTAATAHHGFKTLYDRQFQEQAQQAALRKQLNKAEPAPSYQNPARVDRLTGTRDWKRESELGVSRSTAPIELRRTVSGGVLDPIPVKSTSDKLARGDVRHAEQLGTKLAALGVTGGRARPGRKAGVTSRPDTPPSFDETVMQDLMQHSSKYGGWKAPPKSQAGVYSDKDVRKMYHWFSRQFGTLPTSASLNVLPRADGVRPQSMDTAKGRKTGRGDRGVARSATAGKRLGQARTNTDWKRRGELPPVPADEYDDAANHIRRRKEQPLLRRFNQTAPATQATSKAKGTAKTLRSKKGAAVPAHGVTDSTTAVAPQFSGPDTKAPSPVTRIGQSRRRARVPPDTTVAPDSRPAAQQLQHGKRGTNFELEFTQGRRADKGDVDQGLLDQSRVERMAREQMAEEIIPDTMGSSLGLLQTESTPRPSHEPAVEGSGSVELGTSPIHEEGEQSGTGQTPAAHQTIRESGGQVDVPYKGVVLGFGAHDMDDFRKGVHGSLAHQERLLAISGYQVEYKTVSKDDGDETGGGAKTHKALLKPLKAGLVTSKQSGVDYRELGGTHMLTKLGKQLNHVSSKIATKVRVGVDETPLHGEYPVQTPADALVHGGAGWGRADYISWNRMLETRFAAAWDGELRDGEQDGSAMPALSPLHTAATPATPIHAGLEAGALSVDTAGPLARTMGSQTGRFHSSKSAKLALYTQTPLAADVRTGVLDRGTFLLDPEAMPKDVEYSLVPDDSRNSRRLAVLGDSADVGDFNDAIFYSPAANANPKQLAADVERFRTNQSRKAEEARLREMHRQRALYEAEFKRKLKEQRERVEWLHNSKSITASKPPSKGSWQSMQTKAAREAAIAEAEQLEKVMQQRHEAWLAAQAAALVEKELQVEKLKLVEAGVEPPKAEEAKPEAPKRRRRRRRRRTRSRSRSAHSSDSAESEDDESDYSFEATTGALEPVAESSPPGSPADSDTATQSAHATRPRTEIDVGAAAQSDDGALTGRSGGIANGLTSPLHTKSALNAVEAEPKTVADDPRLVEALKREIVHEQETQKLQKRFLKKHGKLVAHSADHAARSAIPKSRRKPSEEHARAAAVERRKRELQQQPTMGGSFGSSAMSATRRRGLPKGPRGTAALQDRSHVSAAQHLGADGVSVVGSDQGSVVGSIIPELTIAGVTDSIRDGDSASGPTQPTAATSLPQSAEDLDGAMPSWQNSSTVSTPGWQGNSPADGRDAPADAGPKRPYGQTPGSMDPIPKFKPRRQAPEQPQVSASLLDPGLKRPSTAGRSVQITKRVVVRGQTLAEREASERDSRFAEESTLAMQAEDINISDELAEMAAEHLKSMEASRASTAAALARSVRFAASTASKDGDGDSDSDEDSVKWDETDFSFQGITPGSLTMTYKRDMRKIRPQRATVLQEEWRRRQDAQDQQQNAEKLKKRGLTLEDESMATEVETDEPPPTYLIPAVPGSSVSEPTRLTVEEASAAGLTLSQGGSVISGKIVAQRSADGDYDMRPNAPPLLDTYETGVSLAYPVRGDDVSGRFMYIPKPILPLADRAVKPPTPPPVEATQDTDKPTESGDAKAEAAAPPQSGTPSASKDKSAARKGAARGRGRGKGRGKSQRLDDKPLPDMAPSGQKLLSGVPASDMGASPRSKPVSAQYPGLGKLITSFSVSQGCIAEESGESAGSDLESGSDVAPTPQPRGKGTRKR